MKDILLELLDIYLIGVVFLSFMLLYFYLFMAIDHIKKYADIYRKHAKKKKWITEGVNFVRMNTWNEIKPKWTIFLFPLMSFGLIFFIAGVMWRDYK